MYLIGLDDENKMRCGTDWQQRTELNAHVRLKKIAANMITANHGIRTVYAISNYPQALCEMNSTDAGEFVSTCGLYIAGRNKNDERISEL